MRTLATIMLAASLGQLAERATHLNQPPERMTIAALFDAGGAGNTWEYAGQHLQLPDETLRRPADELLAEADRRLARKPARRLEHAFAAHIVAALNHPRTADILLTRFATMDSYGRHEALLWAWQRWDARFGEAAKVVLESDAMFFDTRVLAAVYAVRFPDERFRAGLHQLLKDPRLRFMAKLDGFPASDLIVLGVGSPQTAVQEALRQLDWLAAPPNLKPTEQKLTDEAARWLLRPASLPIDIRGQPLDAAVKQLVAQFEAGDVADMEDLRGIDHPKVLVTLRGTMTLAEAVAGLCVQTRAHPYRGWTLLDDQPDEAVGIAVAGGAVARVRITALTPEENKPAQLWAFVSAKSPLRWPGEMAAFFRLRHAKLADGTIVGTQDASSVSGGAFELPITRAELEAHGGGIAEIAGEIGILVPRMVRRVYVSPSNQPDGQFSGGDPFWFDFKKRQNADGTWFIHMAWHGAPPAMSAESPVILGDVEPEDDDGMPMRQRIDQSGSESITMSKTPMPGTLVWTFAPACDVKVYPVTFRNIKVPAAVWPR